MTPPRPGADASPPEPEPGAGSAGAASPQSAEPPAMPGETLDPNITFEWKQTLPGKGTCKAGVYTGSFSCIIDTFPPWPLDGKVSFTLSGSSEQQRLTIENGLISDLGEAIFSAGLDGELNCLDQRFTADTVDGKAFDLAAGLPPIDQPFVPTFRTFQASMAGNFDDQALLITGSWEMTNDSGDSCSGSFWAGAAP